jgi:hypothetical protein
MSPALIFRVVLAGLCLGLNSPSVPAQDFTLDAPLRQRYVGPCNVIVGGCAEAWSVTRRMVASYHGPLLQLALISTPTTRLDIGQTAAGYADMTTWSKFCSGTASNCAIYTIYAQIHGSANNLVPSNFFTCAGVPINCAAPLVIESATGLPIMEADTGQYQYTLTTDQTALGVTGGQAPNSVLFVGQAVPAYSATNAGSFGLSHNCCVAYVSNSTNEVAVGYGTGSYQSCGVSTDWCLAADYEGQGQVGASFASQENVVAASAVNPVIPLVSVNNIGTNSVKALANSGTLSITVPAGGIPAGSLICVVMSTQATGSSQLTITDTATNSYDVSIAHGVNNNAAVNGVDLIAYAYNSLALNSGNLITYTNTSGTTNTVAISAFYATGIFLAGNARDSAVTHGNGGSSTAPTVTANAAPISPNELYLGVLATNGPSGDTFTQDASNAAWVTPPIRAGTTGSTATTNWTVAGGMVRSSALLTYAPTITTAPWSIQIMAFQLNYTYGVTGYLNGAQQFNTIKSASPYFNVGTSIHLGGGGDLSPQGTRFREGMITNAALSDRDAAAIQHNITKAYRGLSFP